MANLLQSQTVLDTANRTVMRFTNFSDGTAETDALKINAAALFGALTTITLSSTDANTTANFMVGETITSANSGATAIVYDIPSPNAANTIYVSQVSGTFNANDTISGANSSVTRHVVTSTLQQQKYSIDSLTWSIQGPLANTSVGQAAVRLRWQGVGIANTDFLIVSATGQMNSGYEELNAPFTPPASANSNYGLTFSTIGFANQSSYSILIDLRKTAGYSAPNYEILGYCGYPQIKI
jgi:hypothetical protein